MNAKKEKMVGFNVLKLFFPFEMGQRILLMDSQPIQVELWIGAVPAALINARRNECN